MSANAPAPSPSHVHEGRAFPSQVGSAARPRLESLTPLRFFAAVLIVLHHGREQFAIGRDWPPMVLGQGVSFFFVLSGFILTYAYPQLPDRKSVLTFLRARIARIWPAHLTTLALAAVLLSFPVTWVAAVNGAMLHSLVPLQEVYYSYDAPSWSISTEFVFYLLFPILIQGFDRSWWWKLGASAAVVIALMVGSGLLGLTEVRGDGVSLDWTLYINPLSRLLEFVLGMAFCHAWRKAGKFRQWGATRATLFEGGALLLSAAAIRYTQSSLAILTQTGVPRPLLIWLTTSGSLVWFGVLIVVIASERGYVSQALRWRPLVVLGEISYGVYLLHWILFRLYTPNMAAFAGIPVGAAFALFFGLSLALAYAMWRLIESPARAWIRGRPADTGLSSRVRQPAVAPALVLAVSGAMLLGPVAFGVKRFSSASGGVATNPAGACSLEVVEPVNRLGQPDRTSSVLRITGWAADLNSEAVPGEVYLKLTGAGGEAFRAPAARLGTHMPRADVAEALGHEGFAGAGWQVTADLGDLPPDTYRASVVQALRGGLGECGTQVSFVVVRQGTVAGFGGD